MGRGTHSGTALLIRVSMSGRVARVAEPKDFNIRSWVQISSPSPLQREKKNKQQAIKLF